MAIYPPVAWEGQTHVHYEFKTAHIVARSLIQYESEIARTMEANSRDGWTLNASLPYPGDTSIVVFLFQRPLSA